MLQKGSAHGRRRRCRAAASILLGVIASATLVASAGGHAMPPAATASKPRATQKTLRLHLLGFGTPLPSTIDSRPCPQGRTSIPIESEGKVRVGVAHVCVLEIRRRDVPGYGLRRIVQTVLEIDSLPGGTIVSRQTQTILFARNQRRTTAIFRGRILSGTGRYANARGTVRGGGTGLDGKADWLVTLRLA